MEASLTPRRLSLRGQTALLAVRLLGLQKYHLLPSVNLGQEEWAGSID